MGFWQAFGKIIQGKPVFENPERIGSDRDDVASADVAVPVRPGYDDKGSKIIPLIKIDRVRSQFSGANMSVWANVRNTSAVPVRIDKMVMVGKTRQLGNFLSPGELEQVEIYRGPRPRIDSYTKAELYFMQVNTNDYFCADFVVEYDYQSDGTYLVEALDALDYVRDI